ncbi:filamentous hemagglutinin N-terminal domain-containing protein [Nostoc sp. DedVER01b]|uniref:two-partner secretion domain-containing protein n=1 Tax=Nostoc sp. DedVER01b TaxID=3075404 RepID=UPI002AD538E6|nr:MULTISPECIES: filamentous hemagglutinin N-terminal domain-containing protein [unclassified Nostoc]MDZ7987272.1 filamentous hemagglutinin N-terminal domain-containing protein [Nostoc sp. DedVER02]MDZ8110750.1 filamentous hemagglutinin N-terminal domain-containing protein [Nostoc sp. DedVER01b]
MTRQYGFHKCLQFGLAGLLGCFCVSLFTAKTQAQQSNIVPDKTLGAESSQVIGNLNLQGQPTEVITGGATRQINLFHSFQEFNISEGRGAYFFSPSADIQNILARVTGNNRSEILGTLGTFGNSSPNLFLINRNGIVFGKNSQLNIQGSFLGTTANSLIFPNGVEFSAINPQAPPLLSINVPVGLQFGSQPGSITSQAVGRLRVGSGSTLALIGGEIALDGSYLFTQNGQVKLAAVSGDTIVGLNINGSSLGFNLPENVGRAPINLTNGRIIATGENSGIELFSGKIALNGILSYLFSFNGGSIVVDATQLNLDNDSQILSATSGAARGGDIQIQASDAVTLANSSSIFSASDDTGAGGDITINAGKITITGDETPENRSYVSTSSSGKGNGGNLTFNATESVNVKDSFIQVYNKGAGNGGNLTVRATDAINITNNGSLGLFGGGSGSTGNIQIETSNLRVQNSFPGGGVIALASGGGNVGSISIQARNAIEVTQSNIYTRIFLPLGSTTQATAGDITIETQRLNIKDGGDISTSTFSSANAANILIKASEYVGISGNSYISSNTYSGSGNGGNVTIETPQLSLTQGGHISTTSTRSSGNAGNINISAKDVELDGFVFIPKEQFLAGLGQAGAEEFLSDPLKQEFLSRFGGIPEMSDLSSDVDGSNADVRGGTITLDTERLRLSNGGNISTSVIGGRGKGGNLVVHATDSIDITGVGAERLDGSFARSGLFAELQNGGIGSGGSIEVTTGGLNLTNNGAISAATFNQGNGGDIGINANLIDLRGSSHIITQVDTEAKGNAGNISIQTQVLNVQEESGISSATFGNGNAGNLTVKADNISLIGSNDGLFTGITSSVYKEANGKGGDIDITTNNLDIRDNAQIISGSSGTGDAGDIRINANVLKLSGKLSAIASSTNAGNGGNINLNIADLLLLRGGAFISTTAGRSQAGGDGGNININSKFIVAIPKEDSDIKANAYTGSGGNVKINSQGIFGIEARPKPTKKSDITASSELGVSGITNINTPDNSSIQNGFSELSPVIDTNALIANSCISRGTKQQENSFTITGSSGLTTNRPGILVSTYYTTGEVRGVEATSTHWRKSEPIIEPLGLYRLSNGRMLLSRECSN